MARDWDTVFQGWATGPGKTETEHADNAIRAIRNAVAQAAALQPRRVHVFLHGSYRNRINVRQNSDVDVGILCHDTFFYDLPEGTTAATFGIRPATYKYQQFKSDVEAALVSHFGRTAVTRGNKAFDIKENSYRVDADVTAFFDHRRYAPNATYLEGVELQSDRSLRLVNWPDQHYRNAISKNDTTGRRYKRLTRILKRLRIEMSDAGLSVANPIPGFLVECLLWNVPNRYFGHDTLAADLRASLAYLFQATTTEAAPSEWGEVSELKYLFRPNQAWTRQQAHDFLTAAWTYVGFQ